MPLAHGESAHSQLNITVAGNYDPATCKPKAADGLRVYPPDETHSLFIASTAYTACQNASIVLIQVPPAGGCCLIGIVVILISAC